MSTSEESAMVDVYTKIKPESFKHHDELPWQLQAVLTAY